MIIKFISWFNHFTLFDSTNIFYKFQRTNWPTVTVRVQHQQISPGFFGWLVGTIIRIIANNVCCNAIVVWIIGRLLGFFLYYCLDDYSYSLWLFGLFLLDYFGLFFLDYMDCMSLIILKQHLPLLLWVQSLLFSITYELDTKTPKGKLPVVLLAGDTASILHHYCHLRHLKSALEKAANCGVNLWVLGQWLGWFCDV